MTAQCSTLNISHTPNSGPRLPVSARDWTPAQRLLTRAGISQRDIADLSGIPLVTVNRTLSIRWCGRTRFDSVLRVRAAVEQLLTERNVTHTATDLWAAYDTPILRGIDA